MLNKVTAIEIGFGTLLAAQLIPFVFFLYRTKLRNDPKLARRADLLYAGALCALLGLLGLRMYALRGTEIDSHLQMTALHALPIMYGLFAVFLIRTSGTSHVDALPAEQATRRSLGPLNEKIEDLSWESLVISQELQGELQSVIELLKDPRLAKQYGIEVPKGILLNGPPGTGKTSIAKVVANQAGLSFFALKLDEVISKWVGESEKNLTALFESAKEHAPAVLFIDEIDAIGKQRSGAGGQEHREGFLNHLLQLMDGVVKTEGLYIIAATNRADLVDSALKRPGRLNKVIHIGLPDEAGRAKLFSLYLSKLRFDVPPDPQILAELTDGLSPATIREICNQAGLNAFKRESGKSTKSGVVTAEDLEQALGEHLSFEP